MYPEKYQTEQRNFGIWMGESPGSLLQSLLPCTPHKGGPEASGPPSPEGTVPCRGSRHRAVPGPPGPAGWGRPRPSAPREAPKPSGAQPAPAAATEPGCRNFPSAGGVMCWQEAGAPAESGGGALKARGVPGRAPTSHRNALPPWAKLDPSAPEPGPMATAQASQALACPRPPALPKLPNYPHGLPLTLYHTPASPARRPPHLDARSVTV